MMDNRGTIGWPAGTAQTFVIDSYRCRFQPVETPLSKTVAAAGYDIVKTETVRTINAQQGFTLEQGQ
jgi:hypothetical protein